MTLVFGNVWLTETRNPGRTGKYYVAPPIEFHLTSHLPCIFRKNFKKQRYSENNSVFSVCTTEFHGIKKNAERERERIINQWLIVRANSTCQYRH